MKFKIGEKVKYYFKNIIGGRIIEDHEGAPAIIIGLPRETYKYYNIKIIFNQITYAALERDLKKFNEETWTEENL